MIYSRYYIFSKIRESENYFIMNLLSGSADILSSEDAEKVKAVQNDNSFPYNDFVRELAGKGYLSLPVKTTVLDTEFNLTMQNKYHWYDGWFYDKIIAPNQDKLFGQIRDIIEPDSIALDIGCGTGRLAFTIADKCKSVSGIDLSERNIHRALLVLGHKPDSKIVFNHGSLAETIDKGDSYFDYTVLTYVIHEVDESDRISLLIDAARLSRKIIIGDYLVPKPSGFQDWLSENIEFIAGREHYRNYNSYMQNGGIYYLAKKAGLKVVDEILNQPLVNHIVILSK